MEHLFLFNLSPVQSFIEQARKTHDLYAGSRMLAELTRVAALEAISNQIDLVFPAQVTDGSPIPNRFIGKINGKDDAELQTIGTQIEGAVTSRFKLLAEEAVRAAKKTTSLEFFKQIESHWDINWLFYPVKGEGDAAYRDAYESIEIEMQSLKSFRVVYQTPEIGRKCSLDGERNALFFGQETNNRYLETGAQVIDDGLWLAQNEGLSAVSLTKRGFGKQAGKSTILFPSTAEIALLEIISRENSSFALYKTIVNSEEFDFQFCYKENITEKYLRKNGYTQILEKITPAELERQRQLIFGNGELPKHYGLVAFDGDRMGLIMRGASTVYNGNDLEQFQRSVSKRLIAYAEEVQRQFQDNPNWGRIVYTGGDDFLGFINLQYMFESITVLRQLFHNIVNQPLREDGYFQEGINFTFSAGIALAHYKIPLSIVIHEAKHAEELAKKSGRDGFAISALKHSGESHTACYPWAMNNDFQYWNALKQITGFLEKQVVSENFARVLAKSFYLFQNDTGEMNTSEMVEAEVGRTIQRAMSSDYQHDTGDVKTAVRNLLISQNATSPIAIDNFIQMLNIAIYLKRVRKNKKQNNGTKI
jgi:CRISPR-associated protein Cmr2